MRNKQETNTAFKWQKISPMKPNQTQSKIGDEVIVRISFHVGKMCLQRS